MYARKPSLHQKQRNHKPGHLRTVALDVTGLCNMTCSFCYAEPFKKATPLSDAQMQTLLAELHRMGVFHYVLQGGEAILDKRRLALILNHCRPEECFITLVTNGWHMDEATVKQLTEWQVDKICFSLDSGLPHEHDQSRQEGAFQRVIDGLERVKAAGLLASLSTVVTHQNLHSPGFESLLVLAQTHQVRLEIQIAQPVGLWDGKREGLITAEDAAFIKDLQSLLARLPNGQNQIHRDIYCGICDHCPAGAEFLSISVDGHVFPCNFLQFSFGRVGQKPIREIYAEITQIPWFQAQEPRCPPGESRVFFDQYIAPFVHLKKPLAGHIFHSGEGETAS
ncbi:MAG: radical SAM protein [Acidobacteria bacterium]|nr:radical SAM protein [Acidobacteriota bacterium]MCB9396335.1 radical SAM protein [Acidobacteriota bacterium]